MIVVGPNERFTLDTDADFRRYFQPKLAAPIIRAAHQASEKHDRAWIDYDAVVDARRLAHPRHPRPKRQPADTPDDQLSG